MSSKENAVGLASEELGDGITKVVLDGSIDIVSASAIDLKMNLIAGSSKGVLVDMQQVTFIGSMGLRSLVAGVRWSSSHPRSWWRRY
jgi:anti-anti-sigma factor